MNKPKLPDDIVRDTKLMLLYSGLKQHEIARYQGTSQATVSQIKNGDIYSKIDIL